MVRPLNGRHLWLFVFALLGSLAIAQPAFAQNGMIQGVVKDAQGNPVEDAKVTIQQTEGNTRRFETKTNKKGEYAQIGLPSGPYQITVEKDKLAAASGARVRQGDRATVDFVLSPSSGMSPAEAAKYEAMTKAFDEGLTAQKAGNYDEAIAAFAKAAEVNPCAQCFNNIGLAQTNKKDYDKAEAAYKKALEIDANNADSYNGLANIYNAQRKFDLAAAASSKAVELAGTAGGPGGGGSADALFNQGVILWNSGKVAEAKKQFELAIAADANHAESHYQLAMALVNEGNLKGAGAEFDAYLKLAPNGPNAAQAKALVAQLPK